MEKEKVGIELVILIAGLDFLLICGIIKRHLMNIEVEATMLDVFCRAVPISVIVGQLWLGFWVIEKTGCFW